MNLVPCNECDFRTGVYHNWYMMEMDEGVALIHPDIFKSQLLNRRAHYEEWHITLEHNFRPDTPPMLQDHPIHQYCNHVNLPMDPSWCFRKIAQAFISELYMSALRGNACFQSSSFSVKIAYNNIMGNEIIHIEDKTFVSYRNMGFQHCTPHEFLPGITDVNVLLNWMYHNANLDGASRFFNRLCFELDNHCDIIHYEAIGDFLGHILIYGKDTVVIHTYKYNDLTSYVTYIIQETNGSWIHLAQ
jgi:hypothetical protein